MKKTAFLLLHLSAVVLAGFRASAQPGRVRVQFQLTIDGQPLQPGRQYADPFGEPYTVERLRFYLGHWKFSPGRPGISPAPPPTDYPADPAGGDPSGYFLFDSQDSATGALTLTLAAGRYDSLSFLLGVDSLHNVSGAQTGALDPIKGMFWTWRTGYVMAKLEGSSPLSKLPAHRFEYHIGGFEGKNNVLRTLRLGLPPGQQLEVRPGMVSGLLITVDCNAWFGGTLPGTRPIHIASIPSCTEPGVLARQIAENYSTMFAIKEILPGRAAP